MQSVSSRIWTRIAVSISYDDNHYTTGTSLNYLTVYKQIISGLFKMLPTNYSFTRHIYLVGGCPSNLMMTFVFHNSSMNTEVALQPQPRGTESWTVGTLEVSRCDHCWGCSAVSISSSSEFLASSLFKVGSSSVNRASPFWSVHGISLQVSRFDVAPLEIGFDRVFIPQFWSTLI